MSVTYREAAPADHPALQAAMRAILDETGAVKSAELTPELWSWQYLAPERGALVVLGMDGDRICGYYHVLLVRMRSCGAPVLGAMVQDVATLPAYRGRGVFRELGAFALERMRARGVDLVYTFPNRRSAPSFIRDHAYRVVATLPVRAAPLSLVGIARQRLFGPRRARPAPGGDDGVTRLDDMGEAAELARAFTARTDVHLERSSVYLTWRFLDKPAGEYAAWGVRTAGRLRAYLIVRRAVLFGVECAVLMDLGCADGEDAALLCLVRARLGAERRAGVAAAVTMGTHPFLARLRAAGAIAVPARANPRPFLLLTRAVSTAPGADPPAGAAWTITPADWDVL